MNEFTPRVNLLEPKEVEIDGQKFLISKMPCTVGQKVLVNLPQGFIPIFSEFTKYEQYIYEMLSYCQRVYDDKDNVPLTTKAIIDNHVNSVETLLKLEWHCIEHNYGFFAPERVAPLLNGKLSKYHFNLTEILTVLLQYFFPQNKRPYGN